MSLDRREILFGGVAAMALVAATEDAEARTKKKARHVAQKGSGSKHPVATHPVATPAVSLSGPYVDLSTPHGNMLTFARLVGDLELGKQKAGWYNGYVSGVRPGEPVRDLFGFAGFGMARLLPHESGSGYRKVLREVGVYYDLKSQEPLEEYVNPYTSERVKVVHVANDPFNTQVQEYFEAPPNYGGLNATTPPKIPFILPWRKQGRYATLERHIHLYYKNALQPDQWPRESSGAMARVSEFFTYFIDLAELQNAKLTKLPFHGTWSRITPWLPWMLMGDANGHCQYMTYQGGGDELGDVLPRKVMDYIEKKYPLYLNAPDQWVEPSLSSIERYAHEQKPAPRK